MAKLKILKEGEIDITSTDISKFALHSDYPTWKVANSGSDSVTIPADSFATWFSVDINHLLGYKPFFTARIEKDGKSYRIQGTGDTGVGLITSAELVNNNTLRIRIYSGLGSESSETYNVSWTIMYDEQ